MGKLMVLLIVTVFTTSCFAALDQYELDKIRMHYMQTILNVKPSQVVIGNDVRAMQYVFSHPNIVDIPTFPELDPQPYLRAFTGDVVTLQVLLGLYALSSNYTLLAHHQANLNKEIRINTSFNHLNDISQYIESISLINVSVFHESKMILVTPVLGFDAQYTSSGDV